MRTTVQQVTGEKVPLVQSPWASFSGLWPLSVLCSLTNPEAKAADGFSGNIVSLSWAEVKLWWGELLRQSGMQGVIWVCCRDIGTATQRRVSKALGIRIGAVQCEASEKTEHAAWPWLRHCMHREEVSGFPVSPASWPPWMPFLTTPW